MPENIREDLRTEEAKKILETMNDDYGISKAQELIKDNKIIFPELTDGKQYRVRLLSPRDKDELDFLRRKKFGQLFQDKDILMEKDIVRLYKERGLDIEEEFNKEIGRISKKVQDVNFKLGEALANKAGDTILKTYRKEIEELTNEIEILIIRKGHLLEFSLEQQLINYVAKVTAWLSLDLKEGDNWIRAFNSLDDYINGDERLINQSAAYSQILQNKI